MIFDQWFKSLFSDNDVSEKMYLKRRIRADFLLLETKDSFFFVKKKYGIIFAFKKFMIFQKTIKRTKRGGDGYKEIPNGNKLEVRESLHI